MQKGARKEPERSQKGVRKYSTRTQKPVNFAVERVKGGPQDRDRTRAEAAARRAAGEHVEDPPLDAFRCAGRQAHTLPEGLVRLLPGTAGLQLGQPRGSAAIRSRRRPPGGPPEAPPQGALVFLPKVIPPLYRSTT